MCNRFPTEILQNLSKSVRNDIPLPAQMTQKDPGINRGPSTIFL